MRLNQAPAAELVRRLREAGAYKLVASICKNHGFGVLGVLSARRYTRLSACRAECIVLVHWTLASTLHHTAHLFGVDHATVNHHLRDRELAIAEALGLPPTRPERARPAPKTSRRTRPLLSLVNGGRQ